MNAASPIRCEVVPVATAIDGAVVVELVPAPKPWEVARRLAHRPHLLVLDSSEVHPDRGRYSYVAADPIIFHTESYATSADWLAALRLPQRQHHAGLPPFRGGFAGLFGYGLGRAFERIPAPRCDEFAVPDLALGLYDWVVSFDQIAGRAWIVSSGRTDATSPGNTRRAQQRLREVLDALHGSTASCPKPQPHSPLLAHRLARQYPMSGLEHVTSNFDRHDYEAAVARAIEYTHAGDCFQVNLSQRLLTPLREHPFDLYERLRMRTPSPFAAYFDLGAFQILSASPERFLRVVHGEVETRPIKGTRPRGRTPAEDAALIADLTTSAKDRAENVMIVDLLRNDLGRVCEYGSVRVPRLCDVESYNYVHHLVSDVCGRLRPEVGVRELLAATFPGGSVTGAPKVRALEIIAELEPTARGPYCGSLGFIGFDGTMDLNILIRTFTAGRGWLQFPVGGGIVADSDPRTEYEETLAKAAGLLRALEP